MDHMRGEAFSLGMVVSRGRFVALLGLGAGAGLLAACAPSTPAAPTAAPPKPTEPAKPAPPTAAPAAKQAEAGPTTIPHGLSLTWYGHVPTMVAAEKGFFKEVGLDVELVSIVTSADRMLALTSGSLQWTNVGSAAVLGEMAKNSDAFYWIGNIDDSPGNNGLVVQPGIADYAGLRGKKVAVTLNSDAEIILYQLLEANGLKDTDIEIVPMKANDMIASFANKSVDAYQVWEPALGDGLKAVPGAKMLGNEKDTAIFKKNGTQVAPDVLVIRRELVDKYPETTRKMMGAVFKGVDLVHNSPDEAAGIVAEKYFKKSKDETVAGMKSFQYFGAKDQGDRLKRLAGTFADVVEWQAANKRIDSKPDPARWKSDILSA